MVLAVYMPPQEPVDGQALRSMPSKSSSLILPAMKAPTASKAETIGKALPLPVARLDRAAIDIDRRHIGAEDTDHAARHVLVAAAEHEHAVHPLSLHRGFDAVGDDLAGHKRIFHAFGAHRHAVGNRRRAEDLRICTGSLDGSDSGVGQRLQPGIAGRDRRMTVGNADHRLVEIGFLVAERIIHRPVGGSRDTLRYVFRALVAGHDLLPRFIQGRVYWRSAGL